MSAGSKHDDGIWERLARGLQNKEIPLADCPRCGRQDAAAPVPGIPRQQSFGGGANYTFGICRECEELCGLEVTLVSLDGDLSTRAYGFPRPAMSGVFPKQKRTLSANDIVVPPYLPEPVDALFRQARHNLVLRNWDAAGMTYRKTLEVALRTKFGIRSGDLASTIAHVSRSQPSVFKLFAWLTRMAGNKAAHEEEFSEGLAVHLDSLVEQLAVYLFTVPEVIRPRSSPPLSSTVRRVSKVVPRRA